MTARVSCPLCRAVMPAELVVCEACQQLMADQPTGRSYLVPDRRFGTRPVVVTANDTARWESQRLARMTQAGTVAPADSAAEPGAYVVLTEPAGRPAVYRFAWLPWRRCDDCRGTGRWYWTGDGRALCRTCSGAREVGPDLGIVPAGTALPEGGRWATPAEVELPAVLGGSRVPHRGGVR